MQDLRIPSSHAALMSYLSLLVSTGYRYWISGDMAPEKALRFAGKIAELYPIHRNAAGRAYDKERGVSSVQLVMFPYHGKVRYWLLATPGKGIVHERERLSDAFSVAPAAGFKPEDGQPRYRLVQRKARGRVAARWTWVFEEAHYRELRASVKQAADAGEAALLDLFSRLKTIPLFSGLREQLQDLVTEAEATWRKKNRGPMPAVLPAKLPTMPKISVFGDLLLVNVVEKMGADEEARRYRAAQEAERLEAEMMDFDEHFREMLDIGR